MDPELAWVKVYWNLKNFFFCNLYRNTRFSSPEITIGAPCPSKWKLYLFPNGHGPENYVGIYLVRKKDLGPEKLTVLFKICLLAQNGQLSPDGPHHEKEFVANEEWGHDRFFKRADLKPDSGFVDDGTLTIYCEFKVKGSESSVEAPHQAVADLQLYRDCERIRKAMEYMYERSLHSDVALHGSGKKTHRLHKCILEERLPNLFRDLATFPDRVYENNSATQAVLLYAYTGRLDFGAFDWWNTRAVLEIYGLADLDTEGNGLVQKETVMNTHFFVNKQRLTWKIGRRQLLGGEGEIQSEQVVDRLNEIHFRAAATRTDGRSWSPAIDVFSGDESFVRWKVSLDRADLSDEGESCIGSRLSRIRSSLRLSVQDGALVVETREHGKIAHQPAGDHVTLHFDVEYPMCENTSSITSRDCSSESTTSEPLDDTTRLLKGLEALYGRQAGDIVVKVAGSDRTFKVHKCVLASRSRFFRQMLELDMKEKRLNEMDGAPPPFPLSVREALKAKFSDSWIGKDGLIPWAAQSPDITPLDLFFWGYNQITLERPNDNIPEELFADVVDKTFLYIYCGKMEAFEDKLMTESLKIYIDYVLVGD